MGITGIKRLINNSSVQITMTDLENSSLQPVVVGPTQSDPSKSYVHVPSWQDCDMWVPWCTTQKDYSNGHHYITLAVGGTTYSIWQAAQSDGDYVRFSTSGFQNPGTPMSFASLVNGNQDRCIFVNSNGQPSIWPFGDGTLIPNYILGIYQGIPSNLMQIHMNWHQNTPGTPGARKYPKGSPGSGLDFLTFHRDFISQVLSWYFTQPFADAAVVAPWTALPEPLQQAQYSLGYFDDIQSFMANPFSQGAGPGRNNTDDELGIWIEGGIHDSFLHTNSLSVVVNAESTFDPTLNIDGIEMSADFTYFYQIHGLINFWWNTWQSYKANKDSKDTKEKDKEKEKEKDHKEKERKEKDKDRDIANRSSQTSMAENLGGSVEKDEPEEREAHGETFISPDERPPVGEHALEEE